MAATEASPLQEAVDAPTPLAPPRLLGSVGKTSVEMLLKYLQIDVEVVGLTAEVTLVMTFHNPHRSVMHGELLIPLPEGAAVCGYAIDIDGELAEASLVERHKARRAFETEVYRPVPIDPGLVEHVRGNVMRTRIFPLPARGSRQIRLRYTTSLLVDRGAGILHVPLSTTGPLARMVAHVSVVGVESPSIVGPDWADAGFRQKDGKLVASLVRRDIEPQSFRVVLPALPAALAAVEAHENGHQYFALHHLIDQLPGPETQHDSPRKLRLFWDASLSRATTDLQREFDVLSRVLHRIGDCELELIVFRDVPDPPLDFGVRSGVATELFDHLRQLVYDGGTHLGSVMELVGKDDPGVVTLLCTDGIGTLDESDAAIAGRDSAFAPGYGPVFAFTGAPRANHALLRLIAERTGGVFVNLAATSADDAARQIATRPYLLLGVDVIDGDVQKLSPQTPKPAQAVVLVTGRLHSSSATVRLRFGWQTAAGDIVDREVDHVVESGSAGVGRVIPRLWAQQQADALTVFSDDHALQLLELGRTFNLVTPGTSLLVLETAWQHLNHEVEPAPSRKKLCQEYYSMRANGMSVPDAVDPRPILDNDDAAARLDVLQFYARQRILQEIDRDWADAITKKLTTADLVRMVDGALFFCHCDGRHRVERRDLERAALNVLHLRPDVPGLESRWLSRISWWERTFPPPPGKPMPTIEPDKRWSGGGSTFASTDRKLLQTDVTMDRSLSRSIDLEIDQNPGMISTAESGLEKTVEARPGAAEWVVGPLDGDESTAVQEYLRGRPQHLNDPEFHTEWATAAAKHGWRRTALRMLSNLAELSLDDPEHLRMLAYYAEHANADDLAASAYRRVLRLRPDEPQSYRDLALVLARQGKCDQAAALLKAVMHGKWTFGNAIDAIAAIELGAIRAGGSAATTANVAAINGRADALSRTLDVDLRIVLDWNQIASDLDLWVVEPTGELCSSLNGMSADTSAIGGLAPVDVTAGYGPEEYMIRNAPPGEYQIRIFHNGDNRSRAGPAATAKITIFRDFGRPSERREVRVFQVPFTATPGLLATVADLGGCFVVLIAAISVVISIAMESRIAALVSAGVFLVLLVGVHIVQKMARRFRLRKNVLSCGNVVVLEGEAASAKSHASSASAVISMLPIWVTWGAL